MNQNIITKSLTLAETIAHRNPEVANSLLIKNGYPASRNRDELAKSLNLFILKHQDKALTELANIHPDKELLFSNFEGTKPGQINIRTIDEAPARKTGFHNCCGHHSADGYSNCSGCNGSCATKNNHFSADGKNAPAQNILPAPAQALFNKDMLGIVALIALTGIILISLNNKKA